MKNFTLLLLMALTFSSVTSAQQRFTRNHVTNENLQSKAQANTKHLISTRGENSIYMPLLTTLFSYEEGEWKKDTDEHFKYDEKGNITEIFFDESLTQSKELYTYNENNKVLTQTSIYSEDGGKTWVNSEKKEFDYDLIVPNFVTKLIMYYWEDGKWNTGMGNKFDVTRNEKGFVTKMSIKVYDGIDYVETEYTEIEYENGDLPAKTWKHYMADYDENDELVMGEVMRYENIKWENGDGQIVSFDENEFLIGNNRIKEAKIYDNGVESAKLKVTYTNKKDFNSVMSSTTGVDKITHILTYTDEYGSYKEEILESLDENKDGVLEEYARSQVKTFDSHGNLILTNNFEESELVGGSKTDYTYDDNDRAQQFIQSEWNYDEKKYEPMMKVVFSDYVDVTQPMGITTTQTQPALEYFIENGNLIFSMDGANHYAIYNVNGMQVVNKDIPDGNKAIAISGLPNGLYLMAIQGSEGIVRIKFMKE